MKFINKNKKYINQISINQFVLHEKSKMFLHPEKFGFHIVKHPIHKIWVIDEIKGTPWWLKGLKNILFKQFLINSLKKEDIQIRLGSWEHHYIRPDIIYEMYEKYNFKKDVSAAIKKEIL